MVNEALAALHTSDTELRAEALSENFALFEAAVDSFVYKSLDELASVILKFLTTSG